MCSEERLKEVGRFSVQPIESYSLSQSDKASAVIGATQIAPVVRGRTPLLGGSSSKILGEEPDRYSTGCLYDAGLSILVSGSSV